MLKFLFLICLCSYAYAQRFSALEANYPKCSYHVKVESATNPEYSGHYYGLLFPESSPKFARFVGDNGFGYILRCDDRDEDGNCYVKQESSSECFDGYSDQWDFFPPFGEEQFFYDPGRYPEPVECPDSNMIGCQKYCGPALGPTPACVIVDSNGYFVQQVDGSNYTYYDDLTMDVFATTKCDGQTSFPAPANFCETVKTITAPELGCSYHIRRDEPYSSVELYIVHKGQDIQYLKMIDASSLNRGTFLQNCDDNERGRCYTKKLLSDGCSESYESPNNFIFNPPSEAYYDSALYPKPTDCPDKSTGCFKYCEDFTEFECVVVDAAGHIVKYYSSNWTYYDAPSMDEFTTVKCDDTTTLPAPVDFCAITETFTPKFPDCSFNISAALDFSIRDPASARVFNISGVIVDESIRLLKVTSGPAYEVLRCDITNAQHMCYEQSNFEDGTCKERYLPPEAVVEQIYSLLPPSFFYNKTAYPQVVTCPDDIGGTGCKVYCDFDDEFCVLVDPAGFTVRDKYEDTWAYYDEFSLDAFGIDSCSTPSTPIPAPTTDYCSGGQSSSSSASSTSTHSSTPTPSPTPASPSTPVVSSASMVKCAFTVFAIVLAVALL